jgi:hypothetical protein
MGEQLFYVQAMKCWPSVKQEKSLETQTASVPKVLNNVEALYASTNASSQLLFR